MADDDDWETAWDSGAAEARLTAEAQKNDPERMKQQNKELWEAANVPTPEIHYSHSKLAYKPELKLLKRPTQSPSSQPTTPVLTKTEEDALRIEREKKYEEARDRIFGRSSSASPVPEKEKEKKVWDPKDKERRAVPVRGPKGAGEGAGFVAGRGRRRAF